MPDCTGAQRSPLGLMNDAFKLLYRWRFTIYFEVSKKCHKAIILTCYNRCVVLKRARRSEPFFRLLPKAL
jgi:hypothetical protein